VGDRYERTPDEAGSLRNKVIREARINGFTAYSRISLALSQKTRRTKKCVVFTGARNTKGYGQIHLGPGVNIAASRAAWLLLHSVIPEGLMVLHKCDNPPCVNPDHLFLGNARDNVLDCIAKGRKYDQRRSRRGKFLKSEAA